MSDLSPLAEAGTVDPLVGHPADYHVFHKFIERCHILIKRAFAKYYFQIFFKNNFFF